MNPQKISPVDRQILECLQVDPRISMAALAEKVNSSVSPCWRRVKRMVLSCYILSGEEDYLLRVLAEDLDAFARFSRKVLAALPHVREVRSAFVMQTIKESHRLPLPV